MSFPALAASQINAISLAIRRASAFPVNVFHGNIINEIAAFKRGQWYGSVAANPDGPGLIAMDETGKVLALSTSVAVVVPAALGRPPNRRSKPRAAVTGSPSDGGQAGGR